MFRSESRTSTKTGRAPQWTITFAVAGHVIGVVITSSPGPDTGGEQGEVHGGRPRRERDPVLRPDVLGEAALELLRARARSSASRSGGSP